MLCMEMPLGDGSCHADVCARACPSGDRPKATQPDSAP